jgi:hypothetical protein
MMDTPVAHDARAAEIAQRLDELRMRIRELRRRRVDIGTLHPGTGSTVEQAMRAAGLARAATGRLREAGIQVRRALLLSAAAHDRAAERHTAMAGRGLGSVDDHVAAAQRHRTAAELDRSIAASPLMHVPVPRPDGGMSSVN